MDKDHAMTRPTSADERGGWQPMTDAPWTRPIEVETEDGRRFAIERTTVEGEDGPVGTWAAVTEGDHPPCWCDGICWASNSEGNPSEPPVRWRDLTRAQGGPDHG